LTESRSSLDSGYVHPLCSTGGEASRGGGFMKRGPSILVVFLTVFIDLIGFGIVVPLVPVYGKHYQASGWMIGAIVASYSAMQFVFSPIWGRLSDRRGRRPMLLMSTAGACLSYVLFALGSGLANHSAALATLMASRVFAGICGGNITVAQAYIADITPPENRSRRMALIGVAFGLGFIFGPIIGGLGLQLFGHTGPGWLAAALCAANFVLAWRILTESLKPASEHARTLPRLQQWGQTLSRPGIGALIITFFLSTFAFSCFETTLALLVNDSFNLGIVVDETRPARTVIWLFVYCGIISVFIQGGVIGRLVKLMGEVRLIALSLFLTGLSLILLPMIKGDGALAWHEIFSSEGRPWLKMLGALTLLAVGSGLTRAPVFGLLSNLTSAKDQGATIGVAQSAGSLARIIGPIFSAGLYTVSPWVPYLVCGGISIATGGLVLQRLLTVHPAESGTSPGSGSEQAVKPSS
jgi:DHA1 family tetracycline resistance protein-like MFS transporter